jgi:hypothetical protein
MPDPGACGKRAALQRVAAEAPGTAGISVVHIERASAMAQTIAAQGHLIVPIRDIITAIVTTSDNTASDWLLRRIGGPKAVADTLRLLKLDGVDVSRYELEFAADYYGLCCIADMRPFSLEKLAALVEAVRAAVRAKAAKAYESAGRPRPSRHRGVPERCRRNRDRARRRDRARGTGGVRLGDGGRPYRR